MHQNISSGDSLPQPTPTTPRPHRVLWVNHEQQQILHVHKATLLDPLRPPSNLLLVANQAVPDQRESRPGDYFERQANLILDAFIESLPQGTIDHLFVLLARRAASSLIVRGVDVQQFKKGG